VSEKGHAHVTHRRTARFHRRPMQDQRLVSARRISSRGAHGQNGEQMIIWINGAFGGGKTTLAEELHRRLPDALPFDPEYVGYILRRWAPPADDAGEPELPG
jgi:hypothetical protein